jgi:hypothetical protein
MAREREVSIAERDGKLYARLRFKDSTGRTRDLSPTTRGGETTVWTGSQMIVWGDLSDFDNSAGARHCAEADANTFAHSNSQRAAIIGTRLFDAMTAYIISQEYRKRFGKR